MSGQIRDFEGVAADLTNRTRNNKKCVSAPLSESLFFFSVGSNDLFAFAKTLIPGNDTRVDEIVAPIIDEFKNQLQVLLRPIRPDILFNLTTLTSTCLCNCRCCIAWGHESLRSRAPDCSDVFQLSEQ